jgi:hypothetical protein
MKSNEKTKVKKQSATSGLSRDAASSNKLQPDDLSLLTKLSDKDFEFARLKISDKKTFDKIKALVQDARQNKKDDSSLKKNIELLGPGVTPLLKEVADKFIWAPLINEAQPNLQVLPSKNAKLGKPNIPGNIIYQLWSNQGSSANFTVYSDHSLPTGAALAAAFLKTCEYNLSVVQALFGNVTIGKGVNLLYRISLPFQIFIQPGNTGAYHLGTGCTDIYVDAFDGTNSDLISYLVIAEVVECFEDAQGAGWNAAGNNGEALSRVLPTELYPDQLMAKDAKGDIEFNGESATDWLNSSRADWVSNTENYDKDWVSLGCGTLFINWLRYVRNFSFSQIVQAGGSTLAETYRRLTCGSTDGFQSFKALLDGMFPPGIKVNLANDNPFKTQIVGTVKNGTTNQPINGALIEARGQVPNSLYTDSQGKYAMDVVAGPYDLRASAGGLGMCEVSCTAVAGKTLVQDFMLGSPNGTVTGKVTDSVTKKPITGATVQSVNYGTSVKTDPSGNYTLSVAAGTQDIVASASGYVFSDITVSVSVWDPVTQDFVLTRTKNKPKTPSGGNDNR